MCTICGGSVCMGTGGCQALAQAAPQIGQVTYSYAQTAITTVQSYMITSLTIMKESMLRRTSVLFKALFVK